ncbi:hypothetical protein RRG08_048344 [Elysia crispata]|uniref:Uncharacterized protein n=1 Tax=Elysia crispata TaxID=231223 RepID=A0AAE0YHA1_9GAST|nr:hypothetical protein RRG08_048344 [Elysia crispata]
MATAGFLGSKIKAKTNKTMDWLDGKESVLQEQLVTFARRRADVLRKRKKEIERGVDEEIEGRMREVAQARTSKSKKQVDKDVRKAFEEKNVDAAIFQEIHGIQQEQLQQMMKKDELILGVQFEHTCYHKELRKDCTWNARVMEIRQ